MKVKLTSREPERDLCDIGNEAIETARERASEDIQAGGSVVIDDAMAAYMAMHDAAPDDATKALEDLVRAVDSSVIDIGAANLAIQKLRATETGAALIRQAEEREDAGE
jgi:hypothetical protein